MKTCGNCGNEACLSSGSNLDEDLCVTGWQPREPTELDKAQWWFCEWRELDRIYAQCDDYDKQSNMDRTNIRMCKSGQRLEAAIRENAGK